MNKSSYLLLAILCSSAIFAQGITNTIGENTSADKFLVQNHSGKDLMTITGVGKVGVGTTNPYGRLHVVGEWDPNGIDHIRMSGQKPTIGFHDTNNNQYWTIHQGSMTGGGLEFWNRNVNSPHNGTMALAMISSGKVGIGTTNPYGKLHIVGDWDPDGIDHIRISGQKPTIGFYDIYNNEYWTIHQGSGVAGGLAFMRRNVNSPHDGVVILSMRPSGYVGIGTQSPIGMLDVNGSIYQRGSTLHADYVFEEDYTLESIKEHADFMWNKKHLPAIPKAQRDENGNEIVEVGAHRKGIVEELEKAHIYISQLEERIINLEKLSKNK